MRLTAKQATKYVPLAGQAVSAMLGYAALRALGEHHIKDCVRVAVAAQHLLPPLRPSSVTAHETEQKLNP